MSAEGPRWAFSGRQGKAEEGQGPAQCRVLAGRRGSSAHLGCQLIKGNAGLGKREETFLKIMKGHVYVEKLKKLNLRVFRTSKRGYD